MKKNLRFFASAVVAAGMFVVGSAHAALPTEVATALTSVETDAVSLIGLLYPVMIAVAGGFVIFGLVKKGIKKAV
jgi:hypothetical protein